MHGPKALQFFKLLDHHPNYAHSSSSFDHAVDIAGRLRDYKTLWPSWLECVLVGSVPTPKRLQSLLRVQSCGKAYNLFKVCKGRFKADSVSYNIIANGWCQIKRTPKALEVLEEMLKKGLNPSLATYNIMLKGYFRAGQIKEAWEFFLQMKKRECEIGVVTYITLVHGFGVVGEIKRAQKVFNEMVGEGVLPSVATYNALIQVLCKKDRLCHAGEMERAVELMNRMKDDECEPNVQIYNIIIRYFCDAGEIEKGLNFFEKMGSENCLPNLDTYNILISAMFLRKKSDDLLVAGKLLIEMVDRGFMPRKFTFNRVLDGLLLTGNQDFAKEILSLQSRCGRLPRQIKL
ncbi:hypothetical protein FNV43_RR21379 [Rhamnella rubrinervis]|uniref:Pentatricopeptide repeat-containing protein n=1 Tax=Rhamnella rubrinervis TaxID=2594499 RepID=A0A8K0E1K2_9ROSA|nr:hypothetical protein FNV43_RR21379 [Rhamnella rubrinervis]